MRSIVPLLLVTGLFFAGCSDAPKSAAVVACDDAASDASAECGKTPLALGSIAGTVTDMEARPLTEITVTLLPPLGPMSTSTDELGRFGFSELEPGNYDLLFGALDYETRTITFEVKPGEATQADVALDLLPNRKARMESYILEGHYDCAIEAVFLTGDCMIVWKNATGQDDPVTKEANIFGFTVGERWNNVFVEANWTAGTDQMDGLHVYLSPGGDSQDASEHQLKYAVAEGPEAPLSILLESGVPHATADAGPGGEGQVQLPVEGGDVLGLVLPRGRLANEIGQVCDPNDPSRCFLGVGVALDLVITAYVTVFYNQPIPEGFSAMPTA